MVGYNPVAVTSSLGLSSFAAVETHKKLWKIKKENVINIYR